MNQTQQMKPIAAGLASLGRGGDSMLVHMQPREVAGLQSLAMAHGGSLTINPETGLPEAGFLGDILGAVAPIAVGALLGPAGLGMSSLGAGITTGLLTYAITGDPLRGLMGGFGGYGGGGLGDALSKVGAASTVAPVSEVATVGAGSTAGSLGSSAALEGLKVPITAGMEAVTPGSLSSITPSISSTPMIGSAAAGSGLRVSAGSALDALTPANVSSFATAPTSFYGAPSVTEGIKYAFNNPLEFAKKYPMESLTAASPLLAAAAAPPQYEFPTAPEDDTKYEGPYMPTERVARFPTEEERRQLGSKEWQYFNDVNPYPGFYPPTKYADGGSVFEQQDGQQPKQDTSLNYGLDGFTGQDKQQSNAPTVNVINQLPSQDQQPQQIQQPQPQQQLPYEYPRAYAKGGLADLACFAGGGSAEIDYGITPTTTSSAGFQGSYSVPSTAFQQQLDARNAQIEKLMKPYGTNGNLLGTDRMTTVGTFGSLGGMEGPYSNLFRFFSPFIGLSRLAAEAKVGPAPVWDPAKAYGYNAVTGPAPGPTSQYQGAGITSIPTRTPKSPLLGDYTAAVQEAIGMPRLAKGGYLHGPGDGMSDSIPATIEGKQPARLADGEFVVPADVVSHLGNGSTKAGAQRLYKMMDKVRMARTGTKQQGKQIKPEKYMPA